jgi:hypothetical protein
LLPFYFVVISRSSLLWASIAYFAYVFIAESFLSGSMAVLSRAVSPRISGMASTLFFAVPQSFGSVGALLTGMLVDQTSLHLSTILLWVIVPSGALSSLLFLRLGFLLSPEPVANVTSKTRTMSLDMPVETQT